MNILHHICTCSALETIFNTNSDIAFFSCSGATLFSRRLNRKIPKLSNLLVNFSPQINCHITVRCNYLAPYFMLQIHNCPHRVDISMNID